MTNPTRITVAFDPATANLLTKLAKDSGLSNSEIMRRAVKFYYKNQSLVDPDLIKKVHTYVDLLLSGEHVILDVDHWLLFLKLIERSPEQEKFWIEHAEVAKSHGTQLKTKIRNPIQLLERLKNCNFYKLVQNSENDFTLIFGSEFAKKFIEVFINEVFSAMNFKVKINEHLSKLNVVIQQKA